MTKEELEKAAKSHAEEIFADLRDLVRRDLERAIVRGFNLSLERIREIETKAEKLIEALEFYSKGDHMVDYLPVNAIDWEIRREEDHVSAFEIGEVASRAIAEWRKES